MLIGNFYKNLKPFVCLIYEQFLNCMLKLVFYGTSIASTIYEKQPKAMELAMKKTLFLAAFVLALSTMSAYAVPVIDLGTGTLASIGTLVASGGDAAGTGIGIGLMNYADTGIGSGSATVNATLDFDTGIDDNFIRVTGSIPSLGINDPTTVLLEGTFASHMVFDYGTAIMVQGIGPDVKSNILLEALGIPLDTPFAFFGFSTKIATGQTVIFSTDIANTAVPEPGSLLLLGTGLLGLGLYSKRRIKG